MTELLLIDTTQIQPYIFSSNRLRENIGASYLVEMAMGPWILQSITKTAGEHNVQDAKKGLLNKRRQFGRDRDNLDAEVIYVGGGNGMIIFRNERAMKLFIRHYSRRLLRQAPNLQVFTAHKYFDWDGVDKEKALSRETNELFDKVADRRKRERVRSNPLLGLGVTAVCQSTGLPAIAMSDPIQGDETSVYPIAAEIKAKLDVVERANQHLRERPGMGLPDMYYYPNDFDHMGRSPGEQSYIAVVHADGDGIGNHIKQIGQGEQLSNREYINRRREFSDQLKEVTDKAMAATLQTILKKLEDNSDTKDRIIHWSYYDDELARIVLQSRQKGQFYLPFRPLVVAGDDVTFVCDGRIGLSLTTIYLKEFEKQCQTIMEQPFTASAGVAIVKSHYPFARAYGLAGELTAEAKKYRRNGDNGRKPEGGCLDWYFTTGGLYGTLEEMRDREYQEGKLTLRPVALKEQSHTNLKTRTWDVVQCGIDAFQDVSPNRKKEPLWSVRRNKVKGLRDALREGKDAVSRFRTMYGIKEKEMPEVIKGQDWFRDNGWYQGKCGYFDALELADWFIPLE